MRSIGIDLEPWTKDGLLRFHTVRPSQYGLEMHLLTVQTLINDCKPQVVVVDPIGNLAMVGTTREVRSMLTRLIDYVKSAGITAMFTELARRGSDAEMTEERISSIMDTWLLVRDIESQGERNRGLYILKSRGTAHSNQIREFLLTDHGVDLLDVYTGAGGVLTGSARAAQQARETADALLHRQDARRKRRDLERRHEALQAQARALRGEIDAVAEEIRPSRAKSRAGCRPTTKTDDDEPVLRQADKET